MDIGIVNNSPEYLTKYYLLGNQLEINNNDFKGSIDRHDFISEFLKNRRDIDVYLPPSYAKNPNKNYPVIYMHDGNNLFYPELSFAGVHWAVDSTLEKLIKKDLINEVIVVGIHNTPQRSYEYTWQEMKFRENSHGGGGTHYARFIIEELKPFIDKKYRTSKDRNDTAVMGSSLGGLISLYLGINHPEVFSKLGVISPSLWWNYGSALKDIENMKNDIKVWLDMGVNEGKCNCCSHKENHHLNNLRALKYKLSSKGFEEGINLGYFEDIEGQHNEASWSRRLHLPLLFFFGRYN